MPAIQLKELFTPPAFANQTKTYRARLLTFIMRITLLALIIPALSILFTFERPLIGLIPVAAMYLLCLGVIITMRMGYVKLAGILFISAAWIIIAISAIFFGGVSSNAFNFLFLSILAAALLLGWRAGIIFAGLSILAGFALLMAELYGILPQPADAGTVWHTWANRMTVFVLATVLVFIAIRNLNSALEQAQTHEKALRNERNLLRALIDNLPDYIYIKDTQSRFLINNMAHIRALGKSDQEQVFGKTDLDLFPAEQAQEYYADEQEIFKSGRPLINKEEQATDQYKNKKMWVTSTKVPFKDSQGNIAGIVGVTRDITSEKESREELSRYREHLELLVQERTEKLTKANEQLLQKIVEQEHTENELQQQRDFAMQVMNALGQGVSVTNEDSRFEYINPAFARILGYSREKILGKRPYEFTLPDDYHILKQARSVRRTGETNSYELRMIQGDGTIIHVLVTGVPRWHDDQIIGTIAITTDLTKHKQIEEALRLSEERFRQAITSITDHIYMTEVTAVGEHINLYISPNVEVLTGYPHEKFMHNRFFWPTVVIHPDDRATAAAQSAKLDVGQHSQTEYRMIRADGEIIWVRDSARVERKGASKIIYGVVSDITHHKQLEDQLRQSQKMEAIGQLAGGVAHDFNNILTVITGTCELILYDISQDDPLRKDIVGINEAAERAASLTQQLLAFSRQQVLQPEILSLNVIINTMENILRRLIGENIELVTAPDPELGYIEADPSQIEQIILNLVVNARDAMPDGGKLTIETQNIYLDKAYTRQHIDVKSGDYVMLAISDTGQGIDEKTLNRIFEPFFTTKEQGKGTGMGLATVHGIVKQSGGHIWVYSEQNQGTTFKVYIPRTGQTETLDHSSQTTADIHLETGTILLVEDEDMVRDLAYRILLKGGYTVLQAGNGPEAIDIANQHTGQIDLLLTDVIMPGGMNGQTLAQRIILKQPGMKVLFMSGYTDDAIVHHGVLDSGTAFLQKPFTPHFLLQKVREVLKK